MAFLSSSSSFLEAHWSTTGIFRRLVFVSRYFRAKEEALKHRAVKDDDDDDVAKSIEIMVWKKKRAVLFVRDDDDKNDKNEIKKQVLRT